MRLRHTGTSIALPIQAADSTILAPLCHFSGPERQSRHFGTIAKCDNLSLILAKRTKIKHPAMARLLLLNMLTETSAF